VFLSVKEIAKRDIVLCELTMSRKTAAYLHYKGIFLRCCSRKPNISCLTSVTHPHSDSKNTSYNHMILVNIGMLFYCCLHCDTNVDRKQNLDPFLHNKQLP